VTEPLLTARQLAGSSASRARRFYAGRDKAAPGFRLPGGALRYRPEMIDVWLDQHATADGGDREAPTTRYAARHPVVFPIANHPETEED
jgi:hypothetical protein